MALKSSREGLRKELVDYLGNLIVNDNLRNEIIKAVNGLFVTSETLNESVNNLTMQITTETGERIEADDILQNNLNTEATTRQEADNTLQNNINAETTARQEAINNLEGLIVTSGLQMDLLWTNASPTSAFASQTVSLDLSKYNLVYIIFANNTVSYPSGFFYKGYKTSYLSHYEAVSNMNMNQFHARNVEAQENGVIFGNNFTDIGSYNICNIPIKIYGVK